MACKLLAAKYIQENSNVSLPDDNASSEEKLQFLLQKKWKCAKPFTNPTEYFTEAQGCKHPKDASSAEQSTIKFKTHLVETGFLPWVHARGRECIGKVRGEYSSITYNTSRSECTGDTQEYIKENPNPICWEINKSNLKQGNCIQECARIDDDNSECFSCVEEEVKKDKSICPGVDDTENLIGSCIQCNTCIAEHLKTGDWYGCIDGKFHTSTKKILEIAIPSSVGFILLVIAIYFLWIKKKKKKPSFT